MMTLEKAHAGDILRLVWISDSKLEENLSRIGLSPGSTFVNLSIQCDQLNKKSDNNGLIPDVLRHRKVEILLCEKK